MEDSPGQTLVNSDAKVNYKVKLRCSFGGKIKPRHDDPTQLCYSGGEHKIISVERNIKFGELFARLSSAFDTTAFIVKYKHPGYDLDTLIDVQEDDDVEFMMEEYELLSEEEGWRVRMFLFPPRIESKKNRDSIASFSGPEVVFGSDEEVGSDSGPRLEPVVENEDRSVVEPKCGGSDQALPQAGVIVRGLSGLSFGSGDSVKDAGNGMIGKNVESEIPREGHVRGGESVSVAGKAVVSGHTSPGSSAGSNSDDNGKNVELQKVSCEDHVSGGGSVSVARKGVISGHTSPGSSPGSNSDDNGKNVKLQQVPCKDHVSGGACVSVPASGGKTGSGSGSSDDGKNGELKSECEGQVSGGACVYGVPVTMMNGGQTFYAVGSNSDDNGKNFQLQQVPCEDHVSGGMFVSVPASGGKTGSRSGSRPGSRSGSGSGSRSGSGSSDDGKNGELQSECEGQVSGGSCVYVIPVTNGGQSFYAVPAVVNWDPPVYSFVPATVAVMHVNNQVDEENKEANDDQKNA